VVIEEVVKLILDVNSWCRALESITKPLDGTNVCAKELKRISCNGTEVVKDEDPPFT